MDSSIRIGSFEALIEASSQIGQQPGWGMWTRAGVSSTLRAMSNACARASTGILLMTVLFGACGASNKSAGPDGGSPNGGRAGTGGAAGAGSPQTGVKHIWGGLAAMCALLDDDSVKCWGSSVYGYPSKVAGIEGAAQIAIGESHFCALTKDGQVKCWGSNNNGQLGTGDVSFSRLPPATMVPTLVAGISGAVGVTGGWAHTSAVLSDGTVICWGLRAECGLPASPTPGDIYVLTPQAVPGLQQVKVVQAGSYQGNYAILSTGALMTFKDAAPAAVAGVEGVARIAVGFGVFAQTADGSVYGWGENLPLNAPRSSMTPKLLAPLASSKSIASTDAHACALRADGTVACWGNNSEGAVDGGKTFSGTTINANTPVVVPGVTGAIEVATARSTSYALLADGSIMYWGGGGGSSSAVKPVLPSLLPE
jgi:hypothetical protein